METQCKICRRAGEKLFLKGEKCFSPKCVLVRKPYPPGARGQKKLRRAGSGSEYGMQLREKQKLRFIYGLQEKQFARWIKEAVKKRGVNTETSIIKALELRLDNVVARLGFAVSRKIARQMVSHGHIMVNNRKVNIPSYQLRKGDKISIRPQSADKKNFTGLEVILKKHQAPAWLKLDKTKKTGEVISLPSLDMFPADININSIIEFYSR